MKKKRIVISLVIIIALINVFLVARYTQYILVGFINPNINVDGIKLMTTEEKAKKVLGEEEEYVPGFAGCAFQLNYPSKGIFLEFLGDCDTDFYRKVNIIKITNEKYIICNIKVGINYDEALKSIQKQGFTKIKEGFSGYYWKMNAYIVLEKNYDNNTVKSVTIGVRDRISSTRVY